MTVKIIKKGEHYIKSIAEMTQLFAAVPPGITTIDLGKNNFSNKTVAEMTQLFAAIPPGITTMDLGKYNFGNKTVAEMTQIFSYLPPNLSILILECKSTLLNALLRLQDTSNLSIIRLKKTDGSIEEISFKILDQKIYSLGFSLTPPSLINQCAFFISKNNLKRNTSELPEEMMNRIALFD